MARKKELLPYLDPSNYDREQVLRGEMEVPLKDIVGGSDLRYKSFYEDWMPTHDDPRYDSIYNAAKQARNPKKFLESIGWIDVFCLNFRSRKDRKCYVVSDGHRRVAIAHRLGIEKLRVDVVELI